MKLNAAGIVAASLVGSGIALARSQAPPRLDFGSWETLPDIPWPTSDMSVTAVGDVAYLVGGCAADQLWVEDWGLYACGGLNGGVTDESYAYNLTSGSSTTIASAPRRRYRHSAVAVGDEIYVLGGTDDSDGPIPEVDVYDTRTGLWRTEAALNMTLPVTDAAAFVVGGDKIHVVGGYEHYSYVPQVAMQVFDLANPSQGWTVPATGNLAVGRGDFGVLPIQLPPDNATPPASGGGDTAGPEEPAAFMAIGGFDASFVAPLSSTEIFHVANGTWTAGPSLVLPRADKAMVVVGGFPYVLGGETTSDNAGAVPVKDIEVLADPALGWEQDPSGELDLHKFRFSAVE
eukprot:INCI3208.1.p1 GENE.INCI3208.1~~INCI3208.1.p1  ORF type:complete len:345 (+),score=58.41 INCI3208.1:167-1201(+)